MSSVVAERTIDRIRSVSQRTPVPDTAFAPTVTRASSDDSCEVCRPWASHEFGLAGLAGMNFTRRRAKAGDALYREGDRFEHVYAVRSGTLKSCLTLSDGREQVSGFHMGGDIVGLDGVAQGHYGSTAVALEDTEVYVIPCAALAKLASSDGEMHHILGRLMSREIQREHTVMLLLGSMKAEERLAAFLLSLSRRYAARGYSAREFHLRMSRADIGSHLGIKLETVSRVLSAFQQEGLLEVDKRHIRILDPERLRCRFDRSV